MGLFDFFRKNKKAGVLPTDKVPNKVPTQAIPDGLAQYKINYDIQTPTATPKQYIGKLTDRILVPDSKTAVLPEQNEQTGEFIIKLKRKALSGKMVELGTISEKVNNDTLKYIVTTLDAELDRPRKKGGSNPQKLSQIRNTSRKEIESLAKDRGITLTPEFYEILDNINVKTQLILNPDLQIDYVTYEKQLPNAVDITNIPLDELMQYGEALAARLQTLKSIKRPEDTTKHETALINFMKAKENNSSTRCYSCSITK